MAARGTLKGATQASIRGGICKGMGPATQRAVVGHNVSQAHSENVSFCVCDFSKGSLSSSPQPFLVNSSGTLGEVLAL